MWKVANVCPVFKNGDKQNITNYRPIALLSSVSKCLEKIVYKRLYEHCVDNSLLIENNSGFKHNDSTVNLLLSITYRIYKSIDDGTDICVVFLDVSKAFDKVWHEGLVFKLKELGVSGSVLNWFRDYLSHRSQKVVINGRCSSTKYTYAGVPQGSILGPLLFLIYMNNINFNIKSDIKLFADDTALLRPLVKNQDIQIFNEDLEKLKNWSEQWKVNFNPSKTKYIIFSKKNVRHQYPPLFLNNVKLVEADFHKYLGLILSNNLSWGHHIVEIAKKANRRLDNMTRLRRYLPRYCLEILYKTMIRPVLDYGDVIYDGCTISESEILERVQRRAAVLITGAFRLTKHETLLQELGLTLLKTRRKHNRLKILYKIKTGKCPDYLRSTYPLINHNTQNYNFRRQNHIIPPQSRTVTFSSSFFPATIRDWNRLSDDVKNSESISEFKKKLLDSEILLKVPKYFSLGKGRGKIYHTRLRLGLSGLNDHLFRYNLISYRNCNRCNKNIVETTEHFLLFCSKYNDIRKVLFNNLQKIICPNVKFDVYTKYCPKYLVDLLLLGNEELSVEENLEIFNNVFEYLVNTNRF